MSQYVCVCGVCVCVCKDTTRTSSHQASSLLLSSHRLLWAPNLCLRVLFGDSLYLAVLRITADCGSRRVQSEGSFLWRTNYRPTLHRRPVCGVYCSSEHHFIARRLSQIYDKAPDVVTEPENCVHSSRLHAQNQTVAVDTIQSSLFGNSVNVCLNSEKDEGMKTGFNSWKHLWV